jgi:hypothetical protein
MFVRFREVKAEARKRPGSYAWVKRACVGKCKDRPRYHLRGRHQDGMMWSAGGRTFLEGCPLKPACPYRIGPTQLVPYRLNVSLVESRREGGKVRQEHVANLGGIAGELLPAFWSGLSQEEIDASQCHAWEKWAPMFRLWFWEECEARLQRLANRIGPDMERIRQAIAERVPPVSEAEPRAISRPARELVRPQLHGRLHLEFMAPAWRQKNAMGGRRSRSSRRPSNIGSDQGRGVFSNNVNGLAAAAAADFEN